MATPPTDYKAVAEHFLERASQSTDPEFIQARATVGIGYALLHLSEVLGTHETAHVPTAAEWERWAKRMARGKGDD